MGRKIGTQQDGAPAALVSLTGCKLCRLCATDIYFSLQVLADVMNLLAEKTDVVTLDNCSCLLPLLTVLVESDMDRLVQIFKFLQKWGFCRKICSRAKSGPTSNSFEGTEDDGSVKCLLLYTQR